MKYFFVKTPVHKSMKTTAKLHELGYKLLLHPPYFPDLAPSDFFLLADFKRVLAGNKFSTNEEVIAENEAYFEAIEPANSVGSLHTNFWYLEQRLTQTGK
jgi:hypothetical protein